MSEANTMATPVTSTGTKGLAMMASVLGLPLVVHALSGALVSGLGFAVVSVITAPFADKILPVIKEKSGPHSLAFRRHAFEESSVTETVSATVVLKESTMVEC